MTWTLRRRVVVLLGGSLVFTLVMLALGWLALGQLLDARRDVIVRADPAALTAKDLINAYLDQETGVRGFALGSRAEFLEPYDNGVVDATAAQARLAGLAADLPRAPEQAAGEFIEAGLDWQVEVAEPAVEEVRAGEVQAALDRLEQGKDDFDGLRGAYARLDADLESSRRVAIDELDDATARLITVLSITTLALASLGVIVWMALKRWVLAPLDRIGAETRLVAAGDLEHRIDPTGPPELAELSGDAEAMRQRIVAELAAVEATRAQLDEQAAELARSNTELARSNAELEQFAYVASHDLQEPLRKVASFCELLRRRYRGELDERADQYIDYAVDGAKRMQVLINDLLAFSRVGRVTAGFSEVDLNEVVGIACSHLQLVMEETGAEVRVGALPTVSGEHTLLVLLFQNLLENAIKFRGEQAPVIEIAAEPDDGDGAWCFRLSDNGIGIAAEYRDKVFVIFQRLHARERYPGTGIGLAMCRKVVEYHGGHIWIEDPRAGRAGTTFRWTLAAGLEDPA